MIRKILAVCLWLFYAAVILMTIGLGTAAESLFGVGPRSNPAVLFLYGALFFLLVLFALLVRDTLRGKPLAAWIIAGCTLPLSWLQLYYGKYSLSVLAVHPGLGAAALIAVLLNAGFGLTALLCLHSAAMPAALPAARRKWDAPLVLLFGAALVVTAALLVPAMQSSRRDVALAARQAQEVPADAERRLMQDDDSILADPDVLVQIARFGQAQRARSKAVKVLLTRHAKDPRALLGLQLHAAEEYRRIGEAIGTPPGK